MNKWIKQITGGWVLGGLLAWSAGAAPTGALLAAAEIEARLPAITAAAYPDAQTVLAGAAVRIRYEADGTYEQWHEEYVKVLTEDGRRGYQTISSHYTIPYQRGPEDCRIEWVELLKADGGRVAIDLEAHSRDMINPASMSANIYSPNQRLIRVNIPGIEVGDTLHFMMYDRIVHPRMRGTWADWYVFEQAQPILYSRVEVEGPADAPLRSVAHKGAVGETVTAFQEERDGRVYYRWEARDVPQAFPEPNMPPLYTVGQRVLVSTAPDWETVSRWYWNLAAPRLTPTPAIEEEVARLVAGLGERRARIEAVFRFVSQRIRYLGVIKEDEAPGYEPHDVGITFTARHGVCRDKAALLVAMLRVAGFEAYPTLIHNGPKKDTEVPSPFFNHAIVAVREPDGTFLLMDPTDENTSVLLPGYLNNQSYLVATPAGENLHTSPIEPARNNMMRIETTGTVNAAGRLRATTRLDFDGVNDNAYRNYLSAQRQEDREQFFLGALRAIVPGARLRSWRIEPANLQEVGTPLAVELAYEADGGLITGAEQVVLLAPRFGTRLGLVNMVLGRMGLPERRFPLLTDVAVGVRERTAIEFDAPPGAPLALPEEPGRDDAEFTLRTTAAWEENRRYVQDFEFRLNQVEYDPAAYLRLRAGLRQLQRAQRRWPIFAAAAGEDAADARVQQERVTYEIESPTRWTEIRTTRMEILNYAGKKRYAELKFAYNAAWEEVELVSARVITQAGDERLISAEELNRMDQGWVGGAPRYPTGHTLVASLPGVEPGAVIEYTVRRTRWDRPFFNMLEPFSLYDPCDEKEVVLTAPADLPLALEVPGLAEAGVEYTVAPAAEGRVTHRWQARNLPRVPREDYLPPGWSDQPTLLVSAGDWAVYASQVTAALEAAAAPAPAVSALAAELVTGQTTPAAQVTAIRNFVARHVRSTGPSLAGLPLSALSAAEIVLADRYGNTADCAILLVALLRAAGYAPEWVLGGAYPELAAFERVLRENPQPQWFSTVLVRVPALRDAQGAGEVYLNDTDEYAALGACAHEGRFALDLPGGDLTAIRAARPSRQETEYRLALEADGAARIESVQYIYGTSYGSQRRFFEELTPEQRRREHNERVAAIAQSAEADGDLITDFSGYPGRVALAVRLPDFGVREEGLLYFNWPGGLDNLVRLRGETRRRPLYVADDLDAEWRLTAQLPAGFVPAILPADYTFALNDGNAWSVATAVTWDAINNQLAASQVARQAPGLIPVPEYAALLELEDELRHRRRRFVLLAESADFGIRK